MTDQGAAGSRGRKQGTSVICLSMHTIGEPFRAKSTSDVTGPCHPTYTIARSGGSRQRLRSTPAACPGVHARARRRATHVIAALGRPVCRTLAVLTFLAMPSAVNAQSDRPDYRNLRFDEVWTAAQRTSHWDDAIKAMPVTPDGSVTVTLGGQLRWREELFRGFNLTRLDDDHAQSRVLVSGDVQVGQRAHWHGRLFAEVRDAQSYGRTLPGGARPADADRHDMQNLFADIAYGASYVRYGRQEIALNRERLFGVPDWSNTRRGSEGTRAQLIRGRIALEVIDARPVLVRQSGANIADSAARFQTISLGSAPGAAPLVRGAPALWQGYRYAQTVRVGDTHVHRVTTGGRTQWQWGAADGPRRYQVELEAARQHGHSGARTLAASFWVLESTTTWKQRRGAPSLAVGVEEASGDNAGTAPLETFAVLYPAAHAHGGFADVIGRANVREIHLIGTWDPFAPLALRAAVYRFDRRRLDDGIYTKQNTLFRAAGTSRARHAADEIDLTATWRASRHWKMIAGGAVVLPGAFLSGARTERWGFVGTAWTF